MPKRESPLIRGVSTQHLLIKSLAPHVGDSFDLGTVTVFTGPNNSGTTEVLHDIARLVAKFDPRAGEREEGDTPTTHVIDDLTFVPKLKMERLLFGLTMSDSDAAEEVVVQGLGPDLKTPHRRTIGSEIRNTLYRPVITARSIWNSSLGEFLPLRLFYLTPDDRHRTVEPSPARAPVQAPESLLQELQYASERTHSELDAAICEAFDGLHVLLDDTKRIHLSLRTTMSLPDQASDAIEAVRQFEAMTALEDQGDGIKCLVSVVLSMLLGQGRAILLDHPDAFLHPQQSRHLGEWIAAQAAKLGCQVFIATRDPAFIAGLHQGKTDVALVTLTRTDDSTLLRPVSAEASQHLVQFPLLANQHAINALFCDSAVVIPENDDQVIYELVARRELGATRVGFYHAHGGANVTLVTQALRHAHVPVCVVTELDVFQDADTFCRLVEAVTGAPPLPPWLATRERLASHLEGWHDEEKLSKNTDEVESFLDQLKDGVEAEEAAKLQSERDEKFTKWQHFKRDRLGGLPHDLRVWVEELIDELKRKGIFVSTQGRLQEWIADNASPSERANWFTSAIEMVEQGKCPADLRAFVADLVAFASIASAPRAARRGNRA
jgi:predicted ATPase